MLISKLDIRGFGRLAGPFAFAPGLNLVVGDNESGKSTLHDALIRALFGFSKSERRMRDGHAKKDDRKPWDGAPFGLMVALEEVHWKGDGSSTPIRAEWDFDTHSVRVWRDGDDMTAEVLGKGNEVQLGVALLGLGLDEFRQACTLDQDRIAAVVRSDGLTSALTKAVESGSSDVRVDDAVERMGRFLGSLGITRTALRPSADATYAHWLARRDALEEEVDRYDAVRPQLANAASRLVDAEDEQRALATERQVLERRLLVVELAELDERLGKIASLREVEAAQSSSPVTIDQVAVRKLEIARGQLQVAEDQRQVLEEEVANAKPKLGELRDGQRELEGKIEHLAAYEDTDPSALADVGSLWAKLEALSAEVSTQVAPPQLPPTPPSGRRILLVAGSAAVAVLSLALAALVAPLFAGGIALAAALAYLGLRGGIRAPSSIAPSRAAAGKRTADERHELERALVAALDRVGTPDGELGERASAYLAACRKHTELLENRVSLGEVKAEITRFSGPERELADKNLEIEGLTASVESGYRGLDIDTDDLNTAADELETRKAQAQLDADRKSAAKQSADQIELLLAGRTESQLRSERTRLDQRLREHRARHGELDEEPGDVAALREEAETIGPRLSDLAVEIANGVNELELLKAGFTLPPATLREKLEDANDAVAALEEAKEAIRIARETLLEAGREARKNFRPVLEQALSEALPLVTAGRYAEVGVDDELRVSVVAPETMQRVPAEALSRATQDQIFLVERLAIAHVLDRTGGIAPLLLDDPLAHFDRTRLKLGLTLLDEVAKTRQVILFSEDAEIVGLARELCDPCNIVELPAPSERPDAVRASTG